MHLSRLNSCKSYCPWWWVCCIVELKFSGDSYAPFYHLFLEIDDDSKPLTVDQREMVSFKIQWNYIPLSNIICQQWLRREVNRLCAYIDDKLNVQ